MNKTQLGLLGAAAALVALPAASQAAPEPAVAPATSFAELLQPIPNAVQRLQTSDRELAGAALIEAQYYNNHSHNHNSHSHSRAWWRNYYRMLRYRNHHNNHHNNHNNYHNNYNNNHSHTHY